MSKTVFITGASRGIGRATAELFALEGWNVGINYYRSRRQAFDLAEELRELGVKAEIFCADVSDHIQTKAMMMDADRKLGQIDVLVNNAGMAQQKLFTDLSGEEWRRMFGVNMDGIFHTCQCILPQMIHRKSGRIINLSSIWGISGASCEVAYSASKAAVIGFTKALAKEVGPSGITVNCVAPGVIDTEMNGILDEQARAALREETPLGTFGKPEDVANLIVFLASEKANFITGQVISPNGGFII